MTNSNTSEPLEICWQVFEASSTRILTCAMFDASGPGVELRVGYLGDSPLRSQMLPDIDSARVLAQHWLTPCERLRRAIKWSCRHGVSVSRLQAAD